MQQRPLEEEEEEEEEDDPSYFDSSCFDFFDSRKTLLTPLPSGKLTRSVDTVACSPVPQNHDEAHQLINELATHSARATFNFQLSTEHIHRLSTPKRYCELHNNRPVFITQRRETGRPIRFKCRKWSIVMQFAATHRSRGLLTLRNPIQER
jgi:hypothetical protein